MPLTPQVAVMQALNQLHLLQVELSPPQLPPLSCMAHQSTRLLSRADDPPTPAPEIVAPEQGVLDASTPPEVTKMSHLQPKKNATLSMGAPVGELSQILV